MKSTILLTRITDDHEDGESNVGEFGEYIPTQAEIASECRKIRQSWSEAERRARAGEVSRPWIVPMMRGAQWMSRRAE